jgi:predicted NAD/FAD-binding protein
MAGHADQSLSILEDASTDEKRLLSNFAYEQNDAVLHRDKELMPVLSKVWSSWNYLADRDQQGSKVSVSYWMNSLQHLPCPEQIVVTLNPLRKPRKDMVYKQFSYQHPVFDDAALDAQKHLWSLQGIQRTWFCGSYFGYGFHEDGIQSGLAVAEQLGGSARPWNVENASGRIHLSTPDPLTAAA